MRLSVFSNQVSRCRLVLSALIVLSLLGSAWAAPVVVGSFETKDTPTSVTPFGFTGGAGGKFLTAGSTDPVFGKIPAPAQGKSLYGLSWGDPGEDATVEVKCEFANGFTLTGMDKLLLDIYVPSGTPSGIGLGIYFTDLQTWVPETKAVGANDKWVTMEVPIPNLKAAGQKELNLGFKNIKGPGTILISNLRLVPAGGGADTSSAGAPAPSGRQAPPAVASSASIDWYSDIARARAAAEKGNKKLLVFFFTPESEASTYLNQAFSDPKVISLLSDKYVVARLNLNDNTQTAYKMGVFKAGTIGVYGRDGKGLAVIANRVSPEDLVTKLASL
jgi:hypothetical protein